MNSIISKQIVGSLLTIAIVIIVVSIASPRSSLSGDGAEPTGPGSRLLMAENYENVSELVADSDLIVVGQFVGKPRFIVEDSIEGDNVRFIYGRRQMPFQISNIIRGTVATDVVEVTQRAVKVNSEDYHPAYDGKFYEKGAYILFLKKATNGDHYWPTGAFQGAFEVRNGQVFSRNNLPEVEDIGLKVAGEPLERFLEGVRTAVERTSPQTH